MVTEDHFARFNDAWKKMPQPSWGVPSASEPSSAGEEQPITALDAIKVRSTSIFCSPALKVGFTWQLEMT